ncbi:MAG: DUF1345 domain-containing protein [Acidimicrobiia bacterium]|jgi:uncharacterized membrane protein
MNQRRNDEEREVDVELRYVATAAIVVVAALMLVLPDRVANHPRWLVPVVAVLLGVLLLMASLHPRHADDLRHRRLRTLSLVLISVLSAANAASGARLVVDLARGQGINDAATLLLTGGAIWLTNVIVFALWYWELDRGGPLHRWQHPWRDHKRECGFLFPQMDKEEFADALWRPEFVDYLYLSFTNATAFSPTDVMPLSRWAKMAMLVQSALSIVIIVLVVARAVNVLN